MITYRTPSPADAEAMAELGRTSFIDAFGHLYSQADLDAFLEQVYSTASLDADLANPNRVFRVAEADGKMIGYCKLGLELSLDYDCGGARAMELKQLYLRGQQTGSGIGAAFMEWALGEARTRGYDEVILSVWSENHSAQRFYSRHGFKKVGDTIFMVGQQRDEEYLFGRKV
jgi:diamine N-acetyltransferase